MFEKNYCVGERAKKDLHEGQLERIAHLSSMSEIELLEQNPAIFSRFSIAEMQQIFSPSPAKNKINKSSNETHTPEGENRSIKILKLWYSFPKIIRSQLMGATASIIVLLTASAAYSIGHMSLTYWTDPPPLDASLWPVCKRLEPASDGCRYHPFRSMTWERAAKLLDQPITQLRANNQHLIQHTNIQSHDLLIVWRNRLSLEEK